MHSHSQLHRCDCGALNLTLLQAPPCLTRFAQPYKPTPQRPTSKYGLYSSLTRNFDLDLQNPPPPSKKRRPWQVARLRLNSQKSRKRRPQKHSVRKNTASVSQFGVDTEIPYRLPYREEFCWFCKSVWLSGSILNFRIGSVSSIGGLIAVTLFADTVSDSQVQVCKHMRPSPAFCLGRC